MRFKELNFSASTLKQNRIFSTFCIPKIKLLSISRLVMKCFCINLIYDLWQFKYVFNKSKVFNSYSYISFCYLKKGSYSTFSCFDDQQLLTEIIVIQGLHLGLICDLFGTKNKIEIITRILIKCIDIGVQCGMLLDLV